MEKNACPVCGSTNVLYVKAERLLKTAWLIDCKDCGEATIVAEKDLPFTNDQSN